jgi:hypothetical protein
MKSHILAVTFKSKAELEISANHLKTANALPTGGSFSKYRTFLNV